MKDKVGMKLCLFIVIFWIPTSPTASEAVPDGLVYTEVKKTLVQWFQGVLTCRFYRDPIAVYWEKGPDPDNRDLMVVWHNGKVSGPRFEDGSYDIDHGYSLIIKDVSAEDAGRMYCKVSNYNGILIENYTDITVTDTPVTTIPHTTLQMREATNGILQCIVHIKAERVSWKRVTTSSANDSLVVIANNKDDGEVNGIIYDQDTYNMTQDNSLVIRDVQVNHGGLYVCEATDFDTGISFKNVTFLSVVAQPLAPFPSIQECVSTDHYNSTNEYCTLVAKAELTLTCEANGYYPALHLYFLYGSRQVELLESRELNNADGTKNKTITIAAVGSKELYTCVASDIPGGSEDESTSVLLHVEHDELPDKQNGVLIIMMILLVMLILFSSVGYYIWRKRRHHTRSPAAKQVRYEPVSPETRGVDDLTKELEDLKQRVDGILVKHYKRIYGEVETNTLQLEEAIGDINASLFDSYKMLTDWRQRNTPTSSQWRKVVEDILNAADESGYTWPSDKELKSISRHLNEASLATISKELKVKRDSKSDCANAGKEIDYCILKWRNKMAEKSFLEKHDQLHSAMKSAGLKGLVPVLKGHFMYKAELVEMAFQLVIQDLLPIAKPFDISFTKLVSYRPEFHPSHLGLGTINLLSNLLVKIKEDTSSSLSMQGDRRDLFCTKLGKLQYRNVATRGMCVYEMSYGELFRIADNLEQVSNEGHNPVKGGEFQSDKTTLASTNDQSEEACCHVTPSASSHLGDAEENETMKMMETGLTDDSLEMPTKTIMNKPAILLSEKLSILQNILQLTDEDVSNEVKSSITTFTLLKIWKEKPRQSVFNYRAALAYGLRQNKMSRLADQVLAGVYINEETSPEFIQSIVESLTQDQLRILMNLFKLRNGNDVTKQICRWVAGWTKKMKGDSKALIGKDMKKLKDDITWFITPLSKKHRDLNDKLVENGFLALAREVMIIEQELAWM